MADAKKILIVEDDKSFLWILKQSFEAEGFAVVTAETGESGFDAVKSEKPDLVIADILLPKTDGITMVKHIRETDEKIPVIFLTNLKDTNHINEAVELGKQTNYIIKSDASIDQIVTMAKKYL